MAGRHPTTLFAPGFDGQLDDATRRHLDDHLATCPACATAYADQAMAADALRALPAARMPMMVRLPSTPPQAAHAGLLRRLLGDGPGFRGVPVGALAGGLAAAMAVVVVGAVAIGHRSGATMDSSGSAGVAVAQAPRPGQPGAETASSASTTRAGAAPVGGVGVAPPESGAPQPLAGELYPYRVQAGVGGSGETVVLATSRASFAPGATIPVLVEVHRGGAGGPLVAPADPAMTPEVHLVTGAGTSASGASPAPLAPGQPAGPAVLDAPTASPGTPLSVVLPVSLQPGQSVELVLVVADAAGNPVVAAVLPITVT